MAASSVVICNSALTHIGTRRIVALSDPSREARACNDNYDLCRLAVLRMHPWNFAATKVTLAATAITNAVTSSGLIKITAASHGYSTGDYVRIAQVQGTTEANGAWTVTVVDANNFTLDGSTFTNTYSSGGVTTLAPKFDFEFMHALPSNFIRMQAVQDAQTLLGPGEYEIMAGGKIASDCATLYMKYVANISDTTKFDPLFDEALALYLAHKIAFKLTGSEAEKDRLLRDLDRCLQKARFVDSVDEPSPVLDSDVWIQARQGYNQGFVRDPMT